MGTVTQSSIPALAPGRAARQTAIFGFASGAVYLLALGKSIVVAAWYGTGPEMDAFTMAMVLPNFLAVIAAGNWAQALVPGLAGAARASRAARAHTFRAVLLLCLAASVVVTILLFVFALPLVRILAPAFDSAQAAHTARLLRVLAPFTAASVICGYCSAELLSRRQYFLVAVSPAIATTAAIAMILSMPHADVTALAYGTLLGAILQTTVLLTLALRHNRVDDQWQRWTPFARQILVDQLPLMGAAALGIANASIDQAMAGMLAQGNLSALSYGTALNSLVVQTMIMSASWVALPEFAELASSGQREKLRQRARQFIATQAALAAPIAAAIMVFGGDAIHLVFERKTFTAHSTALVASVWSAYSIGLVPLTIGMVCVRILNSVAANRWLLLVGATMLPLNLLLDYLLMQRFGVLGIGLSTSIVYCCSAVLLVIFAGRHIGSPIDAATARTILFAIGAAICSGGAAYFVLSRFPGSIAAHLAAPALMLAILALLYFQLGLFRLFPVRLLQAIQLR